MKLSLFALFLSLSIVARALPYQFIENAGQWDASIKYMCEIPGGYLLVSDNSIRYLFYDSQALTERHADKTNTDAKIPYRTVEVQFVGAAVKPAFKATNPTESHHNYFIGKDPAKWRKNVAAYREVLLENLYKNIDFRLYEINGTLKYEYIVRPGGDYQAISLAYHGAKDVAISEGNMVVKTDLNIFKELKPFTYQNINQKPREVNARFIQKGNQYGFELGVFDRSVPVIIDPELVFSTYSGSVSDNWSHSATYDSEGNLYAGGSVFGPSYFVTNDVFQPGYGGNDVSNGFGLVTDIVINKYSSDGSKLLYATFLGGSGSDVPHSLVVNPKDELVVFGTTASADFPVTDAAFQSEFMGGSNPASYITTGIGYPNGSDCFVAVIAKAGDVLLGATYLGGSDNDGLNDTRPFAIRNYGDEFRGEVVTDHAGNIYVATVTASADFPVTNGTKLSGSTDAIVLRLSPYVNQLQWSTYLGGADMDAAYSVKVLPDNEVFVCGATKSPNWASSGTYRTTFDGNAEGFVAKFKNDKHLAMSYLGTNQSDIALLLDTDKANNVVVLGLTKGKYPVTETAYRSENSGQFIHCLSNDLRTSVFSTVFGTGRGNGVIDIVPTAFLVNDCGNIYVAGWGGKINVLTELNANSTTLGLPTTRDAYQRTTNGSNFYFMILQANARSLLYGTFFGSTDMTSFRGDHLDGGTCRFDKRGIIYHSACVCRPALDTAPGFPLKNAVSASHNSSNCNMAAFKFDISELAADFTVSDKLNPTAANSFCSPADLTFTNKSKNALTYEWFVDGELISRKKDADFIFKNPGEHKIKLVAYNSTVCLAADSLVKTVVIRDFSPFVTADTTLCSGLKLTLQAGGGTTYDWSPATGLSDPKSDKPTLTTSVSTNYTVTIANADCKVKLPLKITVNDDKPDLIITPPAKEICRGDSVTLTASGDFGAFYWELDNGQIERKQLSVTVHPTKSTTYKFHGSYADGCNPTKAIPITIDASFAPQITYDYLYDCQSPAQLQLQATADNPAEVEWEWGNGQTFKGLTPPAIAEGSAGTIKVTATNAIGCQLAETLSVSPFNWEGKIPNVITPNGDGKNDHFDVGITGCRLLLVNRWGKAVFQTEDYQNNWGKTAESGTYYYTIVLPNQRQCKGYLDVLK